MKRFLALCRRWLRRTKYQPVERCSLGQMSSPSRPAGIERRDKVCSRKSSHCLEATGKRRPITELPVDIVVIIASHLATLDKYFLSQTCQAMRRIVSCDWGKELRYLRGSEKVDFLTRIAYSELDRWVCANCRELHAVDILDFPLVRRAPICIGPSRHDVQCSECIYYLEHHHVQLALKLSRLRVNRPYLEQLLAPCTRISGDAATVLRFTAQPKIIEERFILYETVTIENPFHSPISPFDVGMGLVMLCPHLVLHESHWPFMQSLVQDLDPSTELDEATAVAVETPGKEIQGCCEWCPTDYSVFLAICGQELIFRACHDFGTYSSALNPYWRSQVWPDHHGQAPRFERRVGGIRNLYADRSPKS